MPIYVLTIWSTLAQISTALRKILSGSGAYSLLTRYDEICSSMSFPNANNTFAGELIVSGIVHWVAIKRGCDGRKD
jgi:hypothetical protein